MRNWLTGFAAAGLSALQPLGAAAESPATGEAARSPIPFILAAVGLALVIAMVALTVMGKKKNEAPPPEGPQGPETGTAADVPPVPADPAEETPPFGESVPEPPSEPEDRP